MQFYVGQALTAYYGGYVGSTYGSTYYLIVSQIEPNGNVWAWNGRTIEEVLRNRQRALKRACDQWGALVNYGTNGTIWTDFQPCPALQAKVPVPEATQSLLAEAEAWAKKVLADE